MRLPYSEGSVFLVPLRTGGYARGVVARASPKGKVLCGYFFGPRLPTTGPVALTDLDPSAAMLRIMVGDLGLLRGAWPVKGRVARWDRSQWRMPDFARRDPLGRLQPVLVRYADTDPQRVEAEHTVDDDAGLPPDQLFGYGAVEITLTRLLGSG
jgi:hypothetical protein